MGALGDVLEDSLLDRIDLESWFDEDKDVNRGWIGGSEDSLLNVSLSLIDEFIRSLVLRGSFVRWFNGVNDVADDDDGERYVDSPVILASNSCSPVNGPIGSLVLRDDIDVSTDRG
jgi:hypothetical protein